MRPEPITKPRGIFRGVNFMTPRILAFYRVTVAGRTAYVELSEGEGLDREPIFGVTFRAADGSRLEPDPSGVFASVKNAHLHIQGTMDVARESDL